MLYFTLCYPHFTYGNVLWASASNSNQKVLTLLQKRLVRIIAKRGWIEHTNPLFIQFNMLKLSDINNLIAATFVFNTVNEVINSPISFTFRDLAPYNLRNNYQLVIPRNLSNQSKSFIQTRGVQVWNNLPVAIKNSTTCTSFKNKIKTYFIQLYRN